MDIRPGDHRTQRASILVNDRAPFRPLFPAIRGIWADVVAAKPSLAHRPVGTLPLPLDGTQSLAPGDRDAQIFSMTPFLFQR